MLNNTTPLKPFHIIIKNTSKSLENENYHIYDLPRDATVQQIRNYLAEKYTSLASHNFKLIYAGRILDQLQKKFMDIVKEVHQSTSSTNYLDMESYTIHLIMNPPKLTPTPIQTASSIPSSNNVTPSTPSVPNNISNLSQQQLLEQIAQLQNQLTDIRRELGQQQQTQPTNPPQQPQQQPQRNNQEPSILRKLITNFFKFLLLSYLLNGGQSNGNRWLIMAFFFFFVYVIFFSGVLSFLNTPQQQQRRNRRQEQQQNNHPAQEQQAEEEEEEEMEQQQRYRPQNFFSHILYIIYLFFVSLSPSYNPLPLAPMPPQEDEQQE